MNRLMRFDRGTKGCFLMLLLSCVFAGCAWLCMVTVSLLAGSEPAVRPVFHFDMDTDDATQTLGRTDEHGSNIPSGKVRSGCGSTLQDNFNCGTQKRQYLTYQTTRFGSGNG